VSRRKAKNKNILIISITSILLLVSILGAIFYKNQLGQPIDKENDEQKQEEFTSEKSGKDIDEESSLDNGQSEQTGNEDGNTQNNDSNSSIGTESSSDTNNSNESTNSSEANKPNDSTSNSGYIEGQPPSSEPTYINGILLVNKKYPLPSTYNKGEDPVAKAALVKMLEAGKVAGYEYDAFSGFRSYEYQTTLYNRYVNRDGKENADRYSARPGYSEHQTGLAFDIGEKGRQDLWLTAEFGETPAGQWLMNNAHHYGFILRYPLGKEHITGFMYESWHYRYVGIEQATVIYNEKTTLEEYLNIQ
jgi:zinc D-Ala-D-Ala carboxypeptidase